MSTTTRRNGKKDEPKIAKIRSQIMDQFREKPELTTAELLASIREFVKDNQRSTVLSNALKPYLATGEISRIERGRYKRNSAKQTQSPQPETIAPPVVTELPEPKEESYGVILCQRNMLQAKKKMLDEIVGKLTSIVNDSHIPTLDATLSRGKGGNGGNSEEDMDLLVYQRDMYLNQVNDLQEMLSQLLDVVKTRILM